MSHSISTLKCSTLKVWFVIFPHEIFSSISASKNGTNILPASQARTIIGILCCSPTAYIQSTIQPYSISTIFLNFSTFPHLNIHNLVFDIIISSVQVSSVPQLCPILCNLMDYNTPGFLSITNSPEPPGGSNSGPSCQWFHPTISSSVIPFSSCLQSFPASGSFQWVSSLHHMAKVLLTNST